MNLKTFEFFVKERNHHWVEYEGKTYYVRPDADEDDWQTFLMIEENADVNSWAYAINCRITRDEDGDVESIIEVTGVEAAE
jgi:hypothetical protein